MRAISLIVLAGLCALACGYSVVKDEYVKVADKDFLYKQKAVFELLQHVHQNEIFPKYFEQSKTFFFKDNYSFFTNEIAIKEFVALYEIGFLPMNEVFSIYNEYHRQQAIALFHVFYYAKDFETFYKSLIWARFQVNEGMFLYALNVAVFHRADLAGIVLPAPYEVYPYYFFNSETIQTAQNYKMQGFNDYNGFSVVDGVYTGYVHSNYTGYYYKTNEELKISYFTEDIGFNTYYYYFNVDYPFWMGGKEYNLYKDRRGEYYLYVHQQILARYYMERLTNGLGEIPEFSFYEPIKTGYYPALRYYNGVFFPSRDNYFNVYTAENYYDVDTLFEYERRFRDAISQGFITLTDGTHIDLTKPESIEYLGNLIQGNPDSVNYRYYGYFTVLAKTLLGSAHNDFHHYHNIVPSVLEQYETTLRDPMFYQLYKRVISWYWQFKDFLPYYKRAELEFPGVKVESVEMDKLVTYFDYFYSDISNAVDVEKFDFATYSAATEYQKFGYASHCEGKEFYLKARQYRLNHLPFTFKLNVFAEKAAHSVVRVYLAPKYDEFGHVFDLNESRENFYLLDTFKYDLVAGKNIITRNSNDYTWFVKDRTTYYELYKSVMTAYKGEFKFPLDMSESHDGIPSRLMLPKGTKDGFPFQFFFIVSPYYAPSVEQFTGYDHLISSGVGSGAKYVDTLPFGYPFDRKIDETVWYTPNMFYYDTPIFYKPSLDITSYGY